MNCDDARRLFPELHLECCESCHEEWAGGHHEPSQVQTELAVFDVCCNVRRGLERSGKEVE